MHPQQGLAGEQCRPKGEGAEWEGEVRPSQCWHGQWEDGQEEMGQFPGSTRVNQHLTQRTDCPLALAMTYLPAPHPVPWEQAPRGTCSRNLDHQMLSWQWQPGEPPLRMHGRKCLHKAIPFLGNVSTEQL